MDETLLSTEVILERARQLTDSDERRAFLDRACGNNAELRKSIEAMLNTQIEDGSLIHQPIPLPDRQPATLNTNNSPQDRLAAVGEGAGSRIGPYTLVQPLGEGGMGAVWMAEQTEPVKRLVALKVIKAGMGSAHVLSRFEAERQLLALMDHPNIARVFDAGSTSGEPGCVSARRPYFVMELVNGTAITRYCDREQLTLRERLELFLPVCQAVQHAHQKGIIHRDLKPSNVLVALYDGKPAPKVIDFGIAKATSPTLGERSVFTEVGQIVGTLEYMAPEQADLNNLDIDTRADIYSLGVLLYELLTGSPPFTSRQLRQLSFTDILRTIREVEPPKPSTKLSAAPELATIAGQRQLEPRRLTRLVQGDLDWIVMKCLEKERGRRYETANGLARDIQRYLAEEPVEAGPPSAAYRLRKLAWKHRRGLATAAVLLVLLVAAALVSSGLAVWAVNQRNRALAAEKQANEQRDQAEKARQDTAIERDRAVKAESDTKAVLEFFQGKVLSAGRPKDQEGGLGKDVKLSEAVTAAEAAIAKAFGDRPLVEASIRDTLGLTFWYLGDAPRAIQQHKRALALRQSQLGPDHPDTLDSRGNLAVAYQSAGRTAEAIHLNEQNLKLFESKLGLDDPNTLNTRNNLAMAYLDAGRTAEAIPLLEHNLKLYETKLGPDHQQMLAFRNNLALAYQNTGRIAEAIPLLEQNLKRCEAKLGADHPYTLSSRNNLAEAYKVAGRTEEAIRLHEQALKQLEAQLGANHPDTLMSRNNLATAYRDAGRTQKAIHLLEQTLKQMEAKLGPNHPDTLLTGNNLAVLYRATLEQTRKRFGADDARTAEQMAGLGASLLRQHKYAEAEPLLRDCLKIRQAKQPDDWATFHTQSLLGGALLGQRKYSDAEKMLVQSYQDMKQREAKIPAPDKIHLREAIERLVKLYEATGKKEQAAKWHKELEQSRKAIDAPKKPVASRSPASR